MFFEYTLLASVLGGVTISFIYCFITGISPVSSSLASKKKIVSSISPDQKGNIYELGAGWGSLAFPIARRCPNATVTAYELSPIPWLFMRIKAAIFRPKNLVMKRKNFLGDNLSKASLVVCYLHPGAMTKLSGKLAKELDSGSQVICNTFEMPAWKPFLVAPLEDLMCPQIFFYKMDSAFVSLTELLKILSTMS